MAEQRGCPTCKHQHLDGDEEPCIRCTYAYSDEQEMPYDDMYEPMPKPINADWVRSLSNEALAEFIASFWRKDNLKAIAYEWLLQERKAD